MSRSGQPSSNHEPGSAVIVVNFPMAPGVTFEWHVHQKHQLAWAERGVLTVEIETATFILPPSRALWIPARLRHETRSDGTAAMRALYIDPRRWVGWRAATPVGVTPLVASLIGYLDDGALRGQKRARAERLLEDLLRPVPMAPINLRLPSTGPARAIAEGLIGDPADQSTLAEWGRRVGSGERTLARSFLAETGITFGRWRTLARLRAALTGLADGAKVAAIGQRVGYETASAFIAAFRRETGLTPADYFRQSAEPTGVVSRAPARRR
jgi:AraC-like DNA-binding protein/quercetin dioxygenase-like cupin family protein